MLETKGEGAMSTQLNIDDGQQVLINRLIDVLLVSVEDSSVLALIDYDEIEALKMAVQSAKSARESRERLSNVTF